MSQRLRKVVETLGFTQSQFASLSGIDRSFVNRMWNGKQDVSKETIKKLTDWQPSINVDWLMTGEGEMLKSAAHEKKSNENEPLGAAVIAQFSSNLQYILQAQEMGPDNLSSLIGTSPETITQYLDQHRGPSLAIMIRLRELWGYSIDAMLFQDLSDPEMQPDNNLHTQARLEALEKALEDIERKLSDKITKLEEEIQQKDKEDKEGEK